jgi:hypothetical protein
MAAAIGVTALGGGTGCAGFDVKAAWAISESTPMQTVVRRADTARAVVTNVDRIMGNLPVDPDSKWVALLAFKKADAEPLLKDISTDPEFTSLKGGALKVVPAEAWAVLLSKVCSQEKGAPSLYGEINADVHAQYADISAQAKNVGKVKADIAVEQDAIDDKDRAGERADHEAKKKELQDKLDALEKDYKPKVDAFKEKLAKDAAAASPEVKKQIATVVAVLRRALGDAKIANSAALIGYPKAAPGLKDEVKIIVKRVAADTLQLNIGKRPNLEKLAPEIKLSPVSVTIAGLSPEDLGKLKLDDAVKDIAERSKNYLVHVVTLLGFIAETGEMLALQIDLLDVTAKAVGEVPAPGEDFGDLAITATVGPGKAADKRFPVPMEACVVVKAPEPPPASGKGGAGGKGGKGGKTPPTGGKKKPGT